MQDNAIKNLVIMLEHLSCTFMVKKSLNKCFLWLQETCFWWFIQDLIIVLTFAHWVLKLQANVCQFKFQTAVSVTLVAKLENIVMWQHVN